MTSCDRRTVLRGLGTAVTLPWLEAFRGGSSAHAASSLSATPLRSAFMFIPNGVHAPDWIPEQQVHGERGLTPLLEPISGQRDRISVLLGLDHHNAKALGDGPGDHARSSACFLTAAHPRKTSGEDIEAGVSVDQVMAKALRGRTRFDSLELGCEGSMGTGGCDSGYACVYSGNISWSASDRPSPKESNPRALYDRLFAAARTAEAKRAQAERFETRRSVLDFVREDARQLEKKLGSGDRDRLDEYFEGLRGVERQLEYLDQAELATTNLPFDRPEVHPENYREHLRLMLDLMTVAFRTDQTRIATMMWANEGTNRSFPFLGVKEGHHHLSHHKGDASMIEGIRTINRFQNEEFSRFIDRLGKIPEGEGSLLDHTMILFGSAIRDGNRHDHDDLPILMAGGEAAGLQHGKNHYLQGKTPLANLFVSMMQTMGAEVDAFGDSTGTIDLPGI